MKNNYTYEVSAAGRINIIGEHIDYCGGKVLPAALSLKNRVYVRPNGTDKINLKWTTLPDEVTLDINNLESYKDLKYGNYQAGAALMWKRAGHKVIGCDMLHDCTVPFGSGLSSSAAIEVSTIAALATVAGEPFDKMEVALLAQSAEREFAGVNCGIMDQYASANGRKNHAMLLDCKEVCHTFIPVELGEYALVIINCNKPHNLAESKYNERRAETEAALEILKKVRSISCLADLSAEEFYKNMHLLDGKVKDRARHVVEECRRVDLAVKAMQTGDIKGLGKLLNESHASLRDLYEVTGKELDALAEAAQRHPACAGSRMTGAGFGGCTVSLVKKSGLDDFKQKVAAQYKQKTGYDCKIYDAEIADGITVKKL
ncbi:MAG: galactokinase [Clostridia bacterium]|nr:galactokinase [Clostridia bacterium]